ncbi:unnamed protein product [Alopecurus aequalis]
MSIVPYAGGAGSSLSLTCPMLTGENYTVWAIKVEANLDAQGLWEAVAPADATATVDPKKNKTARAYLLGALAEDILLQVSSKKTAAEVWASLKARFVGADRDWRHGGALHGARDDAAMVKKLLDTVPDRLYAAVAGIKQFCDVQTMPFDDALGRLKAFEERTRRRSQDSGGSGGGQLLLTAAQWEAWRRQRNGGLDDDDITTSGVGGKGRRGKCHNFGIRGHFARDCRQLKKEKEQALLADVDDQPGLY